MDTPDDVPAASSVQQSRLVNLPCPALHCAHLPALETMSARTYSMVAYEALLLAGGGGVYLPSGDTTA
jgi:hypothetical protein